MRMALRSASAEAAMEAMASWTRVESNWRSSTRSVSLSKALLCCCKSFESTTISTPSSPPSILTLNPNTTLLFFPALYCVLSHPLSYKIQSLHNRNNGAAPSPLIVIALRPMGFQPKARVILTPCFTTAPPICEKTNLPSFFHPHIPHCVT